MLLESSPAEIRSGGAPTAHEGRGQPAGRSEETVLKSCRIRISAFPITSKPVGAGPVLSVSKGLSLRQAQCAA